MSSVEARPWRWLTPLVAVAVIGCGKSAPQPQSEPPNGAVNVASATASADSAEIDAAILLRDIESRGARTVLGELIASDGGQRWESLLAKAESGEAEWVRVLGQLAPGTDAGSATDTKIVLAKALPKNPGEVLKLVGSQSFLLVDQVCGGPFIEPELAFLLDYFKAARDALAVPLQPELESVGAACRKEIDKGLAWTTAEIQREKDKGS